MNNRFKNYIDEIPKLFMVLLESERCSISDSKFPNMPAIYIFYDDLKAVHVGRTRKLKNRIKGHITENHNSASFAFKSAKTQMGISATYKKGEGRNELVKDTDFLSTFKSHIEKIKKMNVQYLIVDDPIKQYLLELYAALELGTSLTEFDTH